MIRLIAAIDRKRGIAKQGFQPWYIPEDEQYFTEQTKSHGAEILTGSTTLKAMGQPLADHHNYVLTHDTAPIEGVTVVNDLKKFLQDYQGSDRDIWVIGGANVYAQVMEMGYADELYLTHIEADFGCNQFFPEYVGYTLVQKSDLHEQNGFIFTYAVYKRS